MNVQNGEAKIHISTHGGNAGGGLQPFHGRFCRPTENYEVPDTRRKQTSKAHSARRKRSQATSNSLFRSRFSSMNNAEGRKTYARIRQQTCSCYVSMDRHVCSYCVIFNTVTHTNKSRALCCRSMIPTPPAGRRRSSGATSSPQHHGGGEHDRCKQWSIHLGEQNRGALAPVPRGIPERQT